MKRKILVAICLLLAITIQAQNYLLQTEKKEEKKNDYTSEELFVKDNFPTINISYWKDKNIKFLFPANRLDKNKVDVSYKFECNTIYDNKELLGKIVTVSNIYEKKVKCPAGKCKRTYIDFECNNIIFTYEFIGSQQELETTDKLVFDLVYLGDVDIAREKLIGKKVYTKTLVGTVLNTVSDFPKKKYVEVEIIEVASSANQYTPVRIVVKDKENNQYFKYAIIILVIWVVAELISRCFLVGPIWGLSSLGSSLMSVIKATIAPICSILVMSIIVLVMNSKNKKSLTTIITTVTTANIPLVIASVVSILTIFGSSISTITIPFTRLCSAVSIVLMYFTLKSIFGEEKNSEFIKKFALVELVYYIAYIVFSLLNIYI